MDYSCEICGSKQFHVQDGNFFCHDCNTQSQSQYVSQDAREPSQITGGSRRNVVSLGVKGLGRKKRPKRLVDKGSLWFLVEGFQVSYCQSFVFCTCQLSPKTKERRGSYLQYCFCWADMSTRRICSTLAGKDFSTSFLTRRRRKGSRILCRLWYPFSLPFPCSSSKSSQE